MNRNIIFQFPRFREDIRHMIVIMSSGPSGARVDEILDKMEQDRISRERIEEALKEMENIGEVFRPFPGWIQLTDRLGAEA